jgi:hypothetical protein
MDASFFINANRSKLLGPVRLQITNDDLHIIVDENVRKTGSFAYDSAIGYQVKRRAERQNCPVIGNSRQDPL